MRTLRGHQGPVQILADKLVGKEGSLPVLASGGSDCTVRLWGLTSSGGNRGHSPLLATLHGHEQPIKELAVARYFSLPKLHSVVVDVHDPLLG